jgi:hypothetical protein
MEPIGGMLVLRQDEHRRGGLARRLLFSFGGPGSKGATMNPFARFAFFTVARDTAFVTLAAMLLMLAFSFRPELSFEIGATVALTFSIGLLARVYFLTEERFERSEVWRVLPEEERPPGDEGRQWAHGYLETLLLHCAKGASCFAGVLYCTALAAAFAGSLAYPGPIQQLVSSAVTQVALR